MGMETMGMETMRIELADRHLSDAGQLPFSPQSMRDAP